MNPGSGHALQSANWPLQDQDIDIVSLRGFIAQEYFLQTPPLLCNILHNITSYCTLPPKFEVFLRCLEFFCFVFCFCFLGIGFWMGPGKKIRARYGKGGIIAHNCAISPSQPPFIDYNIAQYIFPTTPFIAIKYWQYLVMAKVPTVDTGG